MKQNILPEIKEIAKKDFKSIEENLKENNIKASVDTIHYSKVKNVITATCDFQREGSDEVIAASISYKNQPDGLYSDSDINEMSDAILAATDESLTPITAADEDEVFAFDEDLDDEGAVEEEVNEEAEELEGEEMPEDPEDNPNIETDNNIAGHYIAECNRCQGIFISALTESDQKVEFLSGICPLCEKESDQYIKWIIKPVENGGKEQSIPQQQ